MRVPEVINFYRVSDAFGCFSNFAHYPIMLDGETWPTSEHFFQAQKFDDRAVQKEIQQAPTPSIAARLGRSRKHRLRDDWEAVKVETMRRAVRAKFEQHDDIRKILISTGDATLVEHTVNDDFWGDGGNGSGRNMLGRLLMEVRAELRACVDQK